MLISLSALSSPELRKVQEELRFSDLQFWVIDMTDQDHTLVFRVKSNKQAYLERLVNLVERQVPYAVVEYELVRDGASWYAMIVLDIPVGRAPLRLAAFKGKTVSSAQTQRNTFGAPGPRGLKTYLRVKPQTSRGTFGPLGIDATTLRSSHFYAAAAAPEPEEDQGHWVIGDVHGNPKTLKALVRKIAPTKAWALGDYIDKGPDSKGVLDFLMKHKDTITALRGNHEQMLLYAYANPGAFCFNNKRLALPSRFLENNESHRIYICSSSKA